MSVKMPGPEQKVSDTGHVSNALIPLSGPDFLLVKSSNRQNICCEKKHINRYMCACLCVCVYEQNNHVIQVVYPRLDDTHRPDDVAVEAGRE